MKHLPKKYTARNQAVILLSKIVEGIDDPAFKGRPRRVIHCIPQPKWICITTLVGEFYHTHPAGVHLNTGPKINRFTEGQRELAAFLLRHIDQLGYPK